MVTGHVLLAVGTLPSVRRLASGGRREGEGPGREDAPGLAGGEAWVLL